MVSETYNAKHRKSIRKDLRNSTTSAEAVLWSCLKKKQLLGKKFRRQESLGRYIVDFYCPECCLVIELDGAPHFEYDAIQYDADRTKYLESLGLTVIRFENQAVHDQIDMVLEAIADAIRKAPPRLRRKGRCATSS